jgi:hypothetical protein
MLQIFNGVGIILLFYIGRIRDKFSHFEEDLPKLKQVTTILEIALWKMKINDNSLKENPAWHQKKKIKTDELSFRQQCRVTCGACCNWSFVAVSYHWVDNLFDPIRNV